jgi:RimJ/RimL family protein N-acetyltransferase
VDDRRRRGRDLLIALKDSAVREGVSLCVPVGSPVRALLRPAATRRGEARDADVARLTDWRNQFATGFLTEFRAEHEQTEHWLTETVYPDNERILFMVDEPDGRTFGYMGLASIDWEAGSVEADSIVRGAPAPRGLMGESLQTMLRWAKSQLGLSDGWLRVRSDNSAIDFYKRIGFTEFDRVPLRRQSEPGMVRWVEDRTAAADGLAVVYMRWTNPSEQSQPAPARLPGTAP